MTTWRQAEITATEAADGDDLAPLLAEFYAEAPKPVRLKLLNSLLAPLGPLALVSVAAGAFSRLLPSGRWTGVEVATDDLWQIRADHVLELARYVQQKSPDLLLRLPDLLGGTSMTLGTISGALLLMALRARRLPDR